MEEAGFMVYTRHFGFALGGVMPSIFIYSLDPSDNVAHTLFNLTLVLIQRFSDNTLVSLLCADRAAVTPDCWADRTRT